MNPFPRGGGLLGATARLLADRALVRPRARPHTALRKDRALHIATVELREDLAEEHAESLRANGRRVAVVQRSVSALKVTASVWVVVVELPVVKP